jgi:hypothetical protein
MTKEKEPCQYCGKLTGNKKMHEKYCINNPNSIKKAVPSGSQSIETPMEATPPKLDALNPTQENNKEIGYRENPGLIHRVWKSVFNKPKPEIIEVESPEELIEGLKSYQIPDSNPKTGLGRLTKRDKDFIQVVLVSELIEPKTFWAEKTGMNRIQYKDRMFKLPRDIKGNVFFWHIDKKEPLIDTAQASENDAESSFHELQLFNMAYSVGRAAGANDLMNNLKLILMAVGFLVLLAVGGLIYDHQLEKEMLSNYANTMSLLNYINQTMPR